VPASVRSDAADNSAASHTAPNLAPNLASKAPAAIVQGEVTERALPSVPPSAQAGIQGTVKVSVGVDVDSTGSVENAEIVSGGPSKYFAKLALEAAQRWKFQPPTVAGRKAASRWNLQFDFTSSGTTADAAQDLR
jgi:TonB family protein